MPRLVELDAEQLPEQLTLQPGDVVRVWATGGRIRSGEEIVQILGPFLPGVLALDGSVLSPSSPPNALLLLAQRPGVASIELMGGDPWRETATAPLRVVVKP